MEINIKPAKVEVQFEANKVYPNLENLKIIPKGIEQKFNHPNSYGYDEVVVNAVESEELNITPKAETQVKEGLYSKVTVAGDSELVPENIKEGTSIFGVEGNAKTTSAKITDASYLFNSEARLDYMNELLKLCEGITSTSCMFYNCKNLTSLDLSELDTSKVIDMNNMFFNCSNLIELDLSNFDTSNVTKMNNMFLNCSKLTKIDLSNWDTSNVTDMSQMFINCSNLTKIDLSNFDLSKIIRVTSVLGNITNLLNLKSFKNLGKGYTQKTSNYSNYRLDLYTSTKLTKESLLDVITNGLYDLNLTYDVANGGTLYRQSLVLGATNLAKLTADEIAIATNKGWDVT